MKAALLVLGLVLVSTQAAAKVDRPDEGDLFGGAADARPALAPVAPITPMAEDKDSSGMASDESGPDAFAKGTAKDDALQVGGVFYQQALVTGREGTDLGTQSLTLPLQFDAYLDARPHDRLRG